MRKALVSSAFVSAIAANTDAQVVVAGEDFDGRAVNLISSIGDDSVIGYSGGGAPFPADTEGIYGMNSHFDNHFFAISDSDEFGPDQMAQWTFDISGFTHLHVRIGMGGISNDSFGGYDPATDLVFTAQIDGGPIQTVFDLDAIDPTGFLVRLMDDGGQGGGGRLLEVFGANLVDKFLAESGTIATNEYLDKTPASGPGAGELDVFSTFVNGSGGELVLRLTADMPFEAMVFDNIVIKGVPEPATLALLVLGGLALVRRR